MWSSVLKTSKGDWEPVQQTIPLCLLPCDLFPWVPPDKSNGVNRPREQHIWGLGTFWRWRNSASCVYLRREREAAARGGFPLFYFYFYRNWFDCVCFQGSLSHQVFPKGSDRAGFPRAPRKQGRRLRSRLRAHRQPARREAGGRGAPPRILQSDYHLRSPGRPIDKALRSHRVPMLQLEAKLLSSLMWCFPQHPTSRASLSWKPLFFINPFLPWSPPFSQFLFL